MRHYISTLFCLIIGINLLFPQLKRVEWVDNYRPVSGLSALSEDTCAFANMWVRFDENDELINSYSQCFLTTNRGKSWDCIFNEIIWTQNPLGVIYTDEVVFPSKDLLLIGCDSNKIFKTTNLGETWTQQKLIVFDDPGGSKPDFKHFRKNGLGAMTLDHNLESFYVTLDGAETWIEINYPSIEFYLASDIAILSDSTIIATVKATTGFYILLTSDIGISWDIKKMPTPVYHISYVDDNNIWIYGHEFVNFGDKVFKLTLYKSCDKGTTWEEVFSETQEKSDVYTTIEFIDKNNGIMGAVDAAYIRKTTDGGKSWYRFPTGLNGSEWILTEIIEAPSNEVQYYFVAPHGLFIYDADATSVENSFSDNEALLYPNPAQTEITISFEVESAGSARSEILDVFGVPVAERDLGYLESGGQEVRLDFDDPLPPGLYWARISVGGRVIVKKFVAG